MSTSTPPAWKWRDECYVPVETQELPVAATFSKQVGGEALSADSCNLSGSATLHAQNDSPDPTYQGCRPSERYPSDNPDPTGEDVWPLARAVGTTASGTCGAEEWDDQCPECRCPPDMPHNAECDEAAKVTESVINVASCPECGSVTDLDYGPASVLLPKRESGAEEETCIDDNPLLNHMECTFNSCMDTAVMKNEGYAGSADPMANFNDSVRLGVPVPIGVAIRLSDKWARLCRLLQTGENPLSDESITDTIMDSINYLAILLYALSPATASQDEDTALCGKGLESCFESAGHDGVAGTVAT